MDRFKIGNLWVHFPFVPYPAQEVFMRKMIESMDNAQNALLESPTGTGKTLCLLCASLAWLDNQRKINDDYHGMILDNQRESKIHGLGARGAQGTRNFKIYYCSRTHSQLIQVVNELKNTSYGHVDMHMHVRSAILGSRDKLCLNPCAKNTQNNVNDKCASLRKVKCETDCTAPGPDIEDLPQKCTSCNKDHRCQYYVNFEEMINAGRDHDFTSGPAMDQMSLLVKSRKHKVCAYYMSRHLQKRADITFLPYPYIFSPHILRGLQLNLIDSILIIDEGHNIEQVCEEHASFEMKISDITNCQNELIEAGNLTMDKDFPRDVRKGNICELQNAMQNLYSIALNRFQHGTQKNGEYCLKVFEDAGFTRPAQARLVHYLNQLKQFLGAKNHKTDGIRKIHDVICTLYCLDCEEFESTLRDSFVLVAQKTSPMNPNEEPTIHFLCFNASIIMKSLKEKGVRSFIVTSGTLAPLSDLKQSLSIPFEVNLLNSHVVDSSQILSCCINEAPTCQNGKNQLIDTTLNYRQKNGDQLYDALGNIIREVVRYTPKGVLIFFPSSDVKNDCLSRWRCIFNRSKISLLNEINNLKEIFQEPKDSLKLSELQLVYYSKIDNNAGACLIGVTNGKVSEGIDFKDDYGRAVIIVGLPYPSLKDLRVQMKKKHLRTQKGTTAEWEWYLLQAMRPVNQALGRIIRHRNDYGCVLLCDHRFSQYKKQQALPLWLKPGLKKVQFTDLGNILKDFFSKIPITIKDIVKETEKEQDKTCIRHLEEQLNKEDCSPDWFFDLQVHRDQERDREKRIQTEINLLKKAIEGKDTEINFLKMAIKEKHTENELLFLDVVEKSCAFPLLEMKMDDSGIEEDSLFAEEYFSLCQYDDKNWAW